MKLARRGHPIPQALHANMFLVRRAGDIMEKDFLLIDEAMSFARFPAPVGRLGRIAPCGDHARQADRRRIAGEYRPAAHGQRCGGRRNDGHGGTAELHHRPAQHDDVRRDCQAAAAQGSDERGRSSAGRPRADDVIGVISKEHIADEVASSVSVYDH